METQDSLALDIRDVSKLYPGIVALDKVNLQVKPGTIHGFIGPNGAGKSTTMKIIAGLIPPSEGSVYVNGKDALKDPDYVSSVVGVLPETPPLYDSMTVHEYLKFCQNINNDKLENPQELLETIIKRCGLSDVQKRLIGVLSRGYKQRVAMAQALVYGAKIIVLDEPTVGLDPNAIAEVRELILELRQDHTILLSTHQLHEVAKICDDLTIINRGKIIKTGKLTEIQTELSAFKTYEALMTDFDESLKAQLNEQDFIQAIDCIDHEEGVLIQIRATGNEDYRPRLVTLLANSESLLEFVEKTMELEDIFKEVVK